VRILKKELRLSVDISDSLVDEFFQGIKTTLRSQKNIKLSGFGSFETF
jgi:nucleoid DNA-binding protein